MPEKTDVLIIGGGVGGYVAALRAAQRKKKVLLIEEDRLGGTCMNYGCIPTKHLLHHTRLLGDIRKAPYLRGPKDQVVCDWARVQEEKKKVIHRLVRGIDFLLKKACVSVLQGRAILKNERQVSVLLPDREMVVEAERIIVATGSRPADLPVLKADGKNILTSQEALDLQDVPRSLVVVGGGAIGLELGTIFSRAGAAVTILEILPTILPGSDPEMAARMERILQARGMTIRTQMKIEKVEGTPGRWVLRGTKLDTAEPFSVEAEKVLLAVGRTPNSRTFQPPTPLVALEKDFVKVNEYLETSVPGIYAVGDVVGGKLLAHKAFHEGRTAADNALGGREAWAETAIPMAVFTEPEFASVGWTEPEARERVGNIQVGIFSLQANGRALTMGGTEGLVKLIAGKDGVLLGAHIISPAASEMIPEMTLAIRKKLRLKDVSSTVHIHPTLSEAMMEAALKAQGEAIHVLNE